MFFTLSLRSKLSKGIITSRFVHGEEAMKKAKSELEKEMARWEINGTLRDELEINIRNEDC